MIRGRILAWCQDYNGEKVWQWWCAAIHDFLFLPYSQKLVDKINLTTFNPGVSAENGKNYTELKSLLLSAKKL